jgi:hypothetical protein
VDTEYEVLVRMADDSVGKAILAHGSVSFEEMPVRLADLPRIELEIDGLPPSEEMTFEVRARLPVTAWGEPLISSKLAPRVLPVGVGTPVMRFLETTTDFDDHNHFKVSLQLRVNLTGFEGAEEASNWRPSTGRSISKERSVAAVAKAPRLTRYQASSDPWFGSATRQQWSRMGPTSSLIKNSRARSLIHACSTKK